MEFLGCFGIVLGVLFLLLVVWWFNTLGRLVRLGSQVDEAVGALAAQLQQRFDLIPDTLKATREAVQVQFGYLNQVLVARKQILQNPGLPARRGKTLPKQQPSLPGKPSPQQIPEQAQTPKPAVPQIRKPFIAGASPDSTLETSGAFGKTPPLGNGLSFPLGSLGGEPFSGKRPVEDVPSDLLPLLAPAPTHPAPLPWLVQGEDEFPPAGQLTSAGERFPVPNSGDVSMEDIPPELIPLLAAGSQNAGRNRPVHEDNPQIDVKTYEELQKIMAATEKDVAAARRFVQAAISEFNAAVRSFPGSLVALIHGYSVLPTLKVTPELEKKPDYWSMQ